MELNRHRNTPGKPFGPLQSIEKYANIAAGFIHFLIASCNDEGHQNLLTLVQRNAIADFQKSLDHPETLMDHRQCLISPLHKALVETICYIERSFKPDLDFAIIRYLCYRCIERGSFIVVDGITQIIAALQWLCKAVVYNRMIESRGEGLSAEETIERYHPFLRDGLQSPFNQLQENKHLATAYVYNQGSIGRIQWLDPHGRSVLIDGNRVDLVDIKTAVETGIREAEEHLYNDVLLGSGIATVTSSELNDDLRDCMPGSSFVTQFYRERTFDLLQYISTNESTYRRFVSSDAGEKPIFHMDAIVHWMKEVDIQVSMRISDS